MSDFMRKWIWMVWVVMGGIQAGRGVPPDLPLNELVLNNWSTRNGLPSNWITDINQTPDGLIWVGTDSGLVQFDGKIFRRYRETDLPALASSKIHCFLVRENGDLLIGTDGGLTVRLEHRFQPFRRLLPDWTQAVYNLHETERHLVLLGQNKVWFARDLNGEPKMFSGVYGEEMLDLQENQDGELVVLSRKALYRFREDQLVHWVDLDPSLRDGRLAKLERFQDELLGGGEVALGTWDKTGSKWEKLLNSLPSESDLAGFQYDKAQVDFLMEDRYGTLWQGRGSGVLLREHPDRTYEIRYFPEQVSMGVVSVLFEDRDGQIWVGSRYGGLFLLREGFFRNLTEKHGLPSDIVRAVLETRVGRTNLWIGTEKGLAVYDYQRQRVEAVYGTNEGLSGNAIISLAEGSEGTLWIGIQNGHLNYLKNGRFGALTGETNKQVWDVRAILPTDDRVWLLTRSNGVLRLKADGTLDKEWAESESEGLRINARFVYPTANGDLILAADERGFFRYDKNGFHPLLDLDSPLLRMDGPTAKAGRPQVYGRSVLERPEGVLWLGTRDHGLFRWTDREIQRVRIDDGSGTDQLFSLLDDRLGSLWLSTRSGLNRIPWEFLDEGVTEAEPGGTARFRHMNYTGGHGFSNPVFSGGSMPVALLNHQGHLVFASEGGVVIADPDKVETRRIDPKQLYISNVRTDKTEWLESEEEGGFAIPPGGAKVIEILFGCIEWAFPDQLQLEYRVKEIADRWIDADYGRNAQFVNLPPGDYTFELRANYLWSDAPTELAMPVRFSIAPRWYQRKSVRWFGLLSLIGGAVGLFVNRVHHIQLLANRRREQAIAMERSRIARDMHDDVGGTLTQIKLLSELLRTKGKGTSSSLEEMLDQISGLCREVYRTLDEIVWAVSPKNDTVEQFASYICRYASEFFQSTSIRCRFDIPTELPPKLLGAERRHNLLMVVKEVCNNILRHSQATRAEILIRVEEDRLQLSLKDDGIGFDPFTASQDGDGLPNIRKRLKSIGADHQISSNAGRGTCILIRLNLKSL